MNIPRAHTAGGVLGVKATAFVLDAHGEYAVLGAGILLGKG